MNYQETGISRYDLTLLKVWEVVSVEEEDNAYWSSFDSFDDFMCSWLV